MTWNLVITWDIWNLTKVSVTMWDIWFGDYETLYKIHMFVRMVMKKFTLLRIRNNKISKLAPWDLRAEFSWSWYWFTFIITSWALGIVRVKMTDMRSMCFPDELLLGISSPHCIGRRWMGKSWKWTALDANGLKEVSFVLVIISLIACN